MIGKSIIVTASPNPSLRGVQGVVIDETKHTLRISDGEKEKTLIKSTITIDIVRTHGMKP